MTLSQPTSKLGVSSRTSPSSNSRFLERFGRERKYYLSNLGPDTPLRSLAAAIKGRWVCEQAHQQLKQELGLGHFEGRSWTGLHRHALMTCMAFAYLQHLRLRTVRGRGKKVQPPPKRRTTTPTKPARHAPGHHRATVRSPRHASPMPALQATVPSAT